MDSWPKCKQKNCDAAAAFRYTWAGRDESHACFTCATKLANVAAAIGYRVQMIPLDIHDAERAARSSRHHAGGSP